MIRLDISKNQICNLLPAEWGNLAELEELILGDNDIGGPIPNTYGSLMSLRVLDLDRNALTDQVPSELGMLSNLEQLKIASNMLQGEVPPELLNLTGLLPELSDFRWNALYTSSSQLDAFLSSVQNGSDWSSTQTIAPDGLIINNQGIDWLTLGWNMVGYTATDGHYFIFYSEESGGPYIYAGTTASKLITEFTIDDLQPDTSYYLVVRTVTYQHDDNENYVSSDMSAELEAQTLPIVPTISDFGIIVVLMLFSLLMIFGSKGLHFLVII